MSALWPPDMDGAPSLDDVIEVFQDLHERGTRAHQRAVPVSDLIDRLQERLAEEDHELLLAYEAHVNEVMRLWGEDRFRIGYTLGASIGRLLAR